jgi:hypothetical protein
VNLDKSGGVVRLHDEQTKVKIFELSMRKYFYGVHDDFDTFTINLNIADFKLFQVKSLVIPSSALPFGTTQEKFRLSLQEINPKELPLTNRVMAFLAPQDLNKLKQLEKELEQSNEFKNQYHELILRSSCQAMIHVKSFDAEKGELVVLSSTSEQIPSRYLLCGSIKWIY